MSKLRLRVQVSTHTHFLKWWADSSCHWTIEASAASAGGHRHILIVDDLIKRERGRPPTNRATQNQPYSVNSSDPRSVCVCLLACLCVCLSWGGLRHLNTSDGCELARCSLLQPRLDLFIYLFIWHTGHIHCSVPWHRWIRLKWDYTVTCLLLRPPSFFFCVSILSPALDPALLSGL